MEVFKLILHLAVDFIALYELYQNQKLKRELAKAKIRQLVYKSELGQVPRDYEPSEINHIPGDR